MKARDRVSAWGGKLYFVYLPSWTRYAKDDISRRGFLDRNETIGTMKDDGVIKIANKLNLPVIDISNEIFGKNPDPLSYFPLRGQAHYTPKAYSDIAKAIVAKVREAFR